MPTPLVTDPKQLYETLCAYALGVIPSDGWLVMARLLEVESLRVDAARKGGLLDRATDCRHRAERAASRMRIIDAKCTEVAA